MKKKVHNNKRPKVRTTKKNAKPAKSKSVVKSNPNSKRKLKIMVASTVYNNRDLLLQVCGIIKTYGYYVINSEYGTLHPTLGKNNTEACIDAVNECDIFFGFINPFYSTGITHEEFKEAIKINKPRRFVTHSYVTFSRELLKQFMYTGKTKKIRNSFTIKKTSVMDDIKVIDMYNDAIQHNLPYADRKYHWVHEFFRADELFRHVETLFKDIKRVKSELNNLNNLP